jgi:DNA-binding transcriptional ArsR family regulator
MLMAKAAADPASVFAALGDKTRLTLLLALSRGRPRSIASLSAHARMTRQAVTKHLRVLERVGLVRSDRAGRESRFICQPQSLEAARSCLDAISAQWDDALARLRAHVEEE